MPGPASHPYFDLPLPIPIGHRGCAGEVPENTLASFAAGLAAGAAILESDVHLTRDDVPVLIHDPRVDRVTDGSGRVREHSLAELEKLDAGHAFRPEGAAEPPFRGRGLRIPSLAAALEGFPGARFNLELKEPAPRMVDATLDAIAGREELTLLTAGDDSIMAELRERVAARRSGVALGACAGEVLGFVRSALDDAAPPPGVMALQVPAEFGGSPLVTGRFVAHAHAHGIQVHVWTIDDEDEMHRLLDLGVDGIVTDFPARCVRVIAARR